MGNMPSIYKQKVSLQLDNEVIVALDKKAEIDKTSRNAVANYLLTDKLEAIINAFTPADKAKVEDELQSFKKIREGNNASEIKDAMEKFTQTTYEIFGKVYAQNQQQGQPGPDAGAQGGSNDGHVDADYEVHDN